MHCYILNIKVIGFMVPEDLLKAFPHYKEANDRPSGHGQVGPKGYSWHDLCRGQQAIAIY